MDAVDRLVVSPVRPADGVLEPLGIGGDQDEVDVIGHQAPGDEPDAMKVRLLREEPQGELAVVVGEEDVLAVVAALGHMVRELGQDQSSGARHGVGSRELGRLVR